MNELALFAGAGGGILGGKLLGWRTVCAVERDAYARDVLVARQNDGCLAPFPIWNDVCTFDGRAWRGCVDVVSGGFPCQDISAAGKGAGITGSRSGLWREMARIIGEVRPRFVFVENSPLLVSRGLGVVLADLAAMGFDARWGIVGAHHASAPHKRDRIWIVADALPAGERGEQREEEIEGHAVANPVRVGPQREREERGFARPIGLRGGAGRDQEQDVRNSASERLSDRPAKPVGEPGAFTESKRPDWWAVEPNVGRVAHGVANRVDRLRCIGNGQVPAVVRLAWDTIHDHA